MGNGGIGLCIVLLNEISLDSEDSKCENLAEHLWFPLTLGFCSGSFLSSYLAKIEVLIFWAQALN